MKNILEYQELDGEIIQLEKKMESSKEHEVISKMSAAYKGLQAKLMSLEKSAGELNADYQETLKIYEKTLASTEKLALQDSEKLTEAQLNTSLDAANKLSSELFMLERKLNQILTNINTMLKEFEVTKRNAIAAKNKHTEAKQNLDAFKQSSEPEIKALQSKLAKLEPKQNALLLSKYKSLRNDNIFPIFIAVNDKNCGYCRVELPSHKLDKLKNEEYIPCEQCGRLIYIK